MSENILVVEYEPRYTDRVRHALSGQPVSVAFAKDGEEAMRAIDTQVPSLIVMTAVVPKISATELIKAIRNRSGMQKTPILLTVSGYNGKNPAMDAQKVGASDILPKPYTEADLIGRVQQMLGISLTVPPPMAAAPAASDAKKKSDDLDKILADTLSGARVPKKTGPPTSPGTTPKPGDVKPRGASDLDKLLNDTLSGLEKTVKKVSTSPGNVPVPPVAEAKPAAAPAPAPAPPAPKPVAPAPAQPAAAAPAPAPRPAPAPAPVAVAPAAVEAPVASAFQTEKLPVLDSIPVSQPVFPAAPEPAREEEEEPTDGTKFGQYVLLDRIATGGMAEVWKARMRGVEGFQKTVAIKKILPHLSDNQDFIEMFIDEAKLAAQLSHNNIIHIYDLGKIQNSYYIAMEYVDGSDLKTILRRAQEHDQPMSVELALFIASKVASALDYAHRKRDFQDQEMGLVHRDVSPQNVLISEEGDIKLCDFGIAKAASKASHTQAGALKGKLQYMSPEQAWGRTIDRRSDIFALATVLYEMLTGRKLFAGDSEISILDQVRDARVSAPSDINDEVTPEIDRIVAKALAKDPADRYQTAGELARDLDSVLYSFKPTPTSADLAIYMHRLAAPIPVISHPAHEPEPEPEPEPKVLVPLPMPVSAPAPVAAAAAAAPAASHMPAWESHASAAPAAPAPSMFDVEEPKKKSPVAAIAIAAVVAIALIGGFLFMKSRGDAAPAAAASTGTQVAAASTTTLTTTSATPLATDTASTIALTGTAAAPATSTALDPRLIDQEVQKRLAAERAKLEQTRTQATEQAAAPAAAAPAPARNVPPPVTATQAPAPEPVQPAPVQPAPAQVAETPKPTPAPAEPARVREGDLVPTGTEGLVQPHITKRASVPYPPLAKVQKVQGTVICSVLVSERGDVLDVRVLRGNNRGVGLNEAAEQMMRRSSFAPGTKDGVRVKAWTTVPVDFKL